MAVQKRRRRSNAVRIEPPHTMSHKNGDELRTIETRRLPRFVVVLALITLVGSLLAGIVLVVVNTSLDETSPVRM